MSEEIETQDDLPGMLSVGERLRDAREAKKMSIEDIASKTRIPKRHLEALEKGQYERLPAPTYSIGFAKAYAGEVGLGRDEIVEQLRAELGQLPTPAPSPDGYEVADPARSFPRWLIWLAVLAVIAAVVYFTYNNERQLGDADTDTSDLLLDPEEDAPAEAAQAEAAPPATEGMVTLIADQPVDIRVTDGDTVLEERSLAPGERYMVPNTAGAPMLAVNDASRLRVTVGENSAPPVGGAGPANGISLLGDSLLGQAAGGNAGFGTAPARATRQQAAAESAATTRPAPARAATPQTTAPQPARPRPQTQDSSPPAAEPARTQPSPAQRPAAEPDSIFNSDAPPPPPLAPSGNDGGQDAG